MSLHRWELSYSPVKKEKNTKEFMYETEKLTKHSKHNRKLDHQIIWESNHLLQDKQIPLDQAFSSPCPGGKHNQNVQFKGFKSVHT